MDAILKFYGYPLGVLAGTDERKAEILARLTEIDTESVRPLRAITNGDATDFDTQKLATLDNEAADLRAELASFG